MTDFVGNADDDTFNGGSASDSAKGMGGNDHLYGNGGNDILEGGAGADYLDGGDGDDALASFDADAFLNTYPYGSSVSSDIYADQDRLLGGAGDDKIAAGYGDIIDGGTGQNRLYINFMGATSGVTVDFTELYGGGTVTIGGGTIKNISSVVNIQGSNYDDDIRATSDGYNFTTVHGNGGNDTLRADYYNQYLFGDAGNDVVDGRGSQYLTLVDGGDGDDTLYTNANTFAVANGGAGNDTIYSHGTTYGGDGNDTIYLQATYYAGYVYGENGDDTIYAAATGNIISGGDGADKLIGNSGDDILASGSFPPYSSVAAPDNGTEHDQLSGGGGNDTLYIGYGDDADGGTGTNTLLLSLGGAASGVTFDVSNILAGGVAPGGGTISNIQVVDTVYGSAFGDTLTAGTQTSAITLYGGGGDDHLIGGGSSVSFHGGSGNDVISGGTAADIIFIDSADDLQSGDIYDGGGGVDTLRINLTDDVNISAVTLSNIERLQTDSYYGQISLTAGQLDGLTFISGGSLALTTAGSVSMAGVSVSGSGIVRLSAAGNVFDLTGVLGDIASFTIYGGVGADTVTGSGAGDALFSGGGLDTFHGGGGDDRLMANGPGTLTAGSTFDGGSGDDTLYVTSLGGADLSTSTLTSIEHLVAVGNSYATGLTTAQLLSVQSLSGSFVLTTGGTLALSGYDLAAFSLTLSAVGNIVDLAGTISPNVFMTGGAGNDVISGAAQSLNFHGQGGDDWISGGNGADVLMGDLGNDTIIGNDGIDYLEGGDGNDMLNGGADEDFLQGGAGNDLLIGGLGSDRLNGGTGVDTASYENEQGGVSVNLATQSGAFGAAAGDTLFGIENVIGTASNDILTGDGGANRLDGGGGDDLLVGGLGADALVGGAGNDTLNGGAGIDSAVFSGSHTDYTITFSPDSQSFAIADQRAGSPDGTDSISQIELLQFSDGIYVYDSQGDLLPQTVHNADGTTSVTQLDTLGTTPWIKQVSVFDAQGSLANQTVYNHNGAVWQNGYDTTNSATWSWYTTAYNASHSLVSQTGLYDNGTHWLTLFDASNAYSWSNVTIYFDANWNQYALTGINDNGSTNVTMSDVAAAYDTLLWFTTPYDPNFNAAPQDMVLSGGDGVDILYGHGGNDTLSGGGGDDLLVGGAGNDSLSGGDGRDVAIFSGAHSDYTVTLDALTQLLTVTDQRDSAPDGTDTISQVEQFQFSDGTFDANGLVAPQIVHNNGVAITEAAYDAVSAPPGVTPVSTLDTYNWTGNDGTSVRDAAEVSSASGPPILDLSGLGIGADAPGTGLGWPVLGEAEFVGGPALLLVDTLLDGMQTAQIVAQEFDGTAWRPWHAPATIVTHDFML